MIGTWYSKKELGKRLALLSICGSLGAGLSGVIQALMLKTMDGKFGLSGYEILQSRNPNLLKKILIYRWRWMFLFDATITAFLAGLGFRFLPDYPHNTKWLSKAEKSLSMKRIELNNPQSTQTGPTKRIEKIKAVVSNKYLYPFIFAWASIHIALGATHLLGIISKKLGFDAITSNLLTTVS